eukprot:UN12463
MYVEGYLKHSPDFVVSLNKKNQGDTTRTWGFF